MLGSDAATPAQPDNEFVALLDGFVLGEDPRNGHLVGPLYRHGWTGFAVEFPDNWTVIKMPPGALATSPDGAIKFAATPNFFNTPTVQQALASMSASKRIVLYDRHNYTVGGLPVVRTRFRFDHDEPVVGVLQLAQSREGVITLIAAGLESDWPAHEYEVATALNSHRLLSETDNAALQPSTIHVIAATEGQTLRTIAQDPRELPMLRRLNRIRADDRLEEGRLIKRAPISVDAPPPAPLPDNVQGGAGQTPKEAEASPRERAPVAE